MSSSPWRKRPPRNEGLSSSPTTTVRVNRMGTMGLVAGSSSTKANTSSTNPNNSAGNTNAAAFLTDITSIHSNNNASTAAAAAAAASSSPLKKKTSPSSSSPSHNNPSPSQSPLLPLNVSVGSPSNPNHNNGPTPRQVGTLAKHATSFYALKMRHEMPDIYEKSPLGVGGGVAGKNGKGRGGDNAERAAKKELAFLHNNANDGSAFQKSLLLSEPSLSENKRTSNGERGGGGGEGGDANDSLVVLLSVASPAGGRGVASEKEGRQQYEALIEDEVAFLDQKVQKAMQKLTSALGGGDSVDEDNDRVHREFKKKTTTTPQRIVLPPIGKFALSSPSASTIFLSPSPSSSSSPPRQQTFPLTLNVDAEALKKQRYLKALERCCQQADKYSAIIAANARLKREEEARLRAEEEEANEAIVPRGGDDNDTAKRTTKKRTIKTVIGEWQKLVDADEKKYAEELMTIAAARANPSSSLPTMMTKEDALNTSKSEANASKKPPSRAATTSSEASTHHPQQPASPLRLTEEEEEALLQKQFERLELRRINRARERIGLAPLDGSGGGGGGATTASSSLSRQQPKRDNAVNMKAAAAEHSKLIKMRQLLDSKKSEADYDLEDAHALLIGTREERAQRMREIEKRIASRVLKAHLAGEGVEAGGGSSSNNKTSNRVSNNQSDLATNTAEPSNLMTFIRQHESGGGDGGADPPAAPAAAAVASKATNSNTVPRIDIDASSAANKKSQARGDDDKNNMSNQPSPRSARGQEKKDNGSGTARGTANNESSSTNGTKTKNKQQQQTLLSLDDGPSYEELLGEKEKLKASATAAVHLLTHRHWRLAKGSSIDVFPEPRMGTQIVASLHGEKLLKELEVRRGGHAVVGGGLMGSHTTQDVRGATTTKATSESSEEKDDSNGGGGSGRGAAEDALALVAEANRRTLWVRIDEGWVAAELAVPSAKGEAVVRLLKEVGAWDGAASSPMGKGAQTGLLDLYDGEKKKDVTLTTTTLSSSLLPPTTTAPLLQPSFEIIRQLTPVAVQPLAGVSIAQLLQEVVDDRGDQIQRAVAHCPPESLTRHEYFTTATSSPSRPNSKQKKVKGGGGAALSSSSSAATSTAATREQALRFKQREDELFRRQQIRDQSVGHASLIRQTWEAMGGYNPNSAPAEGKKRASASSKEEVEDEDADDDDGKPRIGDIPDLHFDDDDEDANDNNGAAVKKRDRRGMRGVLGYQSEGDKFAFDLDVLTDVRIGQK